MAEAEWLYPAPRASPVVALRGTIFFLDWCWLRENDLFDRYQLLLEPSKRREVLDVTVAMWVPIGLGLAHYRALDSLSLTRTQLFDVGWGASDRVHGMVLKTMIRLAGQLGVTPWLALRQSHKLWERSWNGGRVLAAREGERAALVEVRDASVVQSRFFRGSLAGAVASGIAPFCARPNVVELDERRTNTSFRVRIAWQL